MNSIDRIAEYDRHTSQYHTTHRAEPLRAKRDHEKHSYRPLDEVRHTDSGHGRERGYHGRSNHRYKTPKILLNDALPDLQGALEAAADYYGSFIEDFDRDIRYIRPYAGSRIMEQLWVNKILLSDEPSRKGDRPQSRAAASPGLGRPIPGYSFQRVGREVLDRFRIVKGSYASSRESRLDPQTADRIRKKLEQASREIFKLMRTAVQQKVDADALVTEMEMVLTFLDKTGPQRSHRGTRNNDREQGAEGYEGPNADGLDGQMGFKDEQGGFLDEQGGYKEGQGILPINRLI